MVTAESYSKDRHAILREQHPIVLKNYHVDTPETIRVYQRIADKVWQRNAGVYMYGPTRSGKTYCVDIVELKLQDQFPKAFMMRFTATSGRNDRKTIFRDMLMSQSLTIPGRLTINESTVKLQTFIEQNVIAKGGNQFILLVDEMQRLQGPDLEMLQNIHDRLHARRVRMTTIGFAQPDISYLVIALKESGMESTLARFFSSSAKFVGCAGKDDLFHILKEYDLSLHYPIHSGISYTEFFAPLAYSNGFRLMDQCDLIWHHMSTVMNGSELPMQGVAGTIEWLLLRLEQLDHQKLVLSSSLLGEAIEGSGFLDYAHITRQ